MGGIKACLLAIRASPDNAKVVENGLVALAKMAETGEKACEEIGKSGLSAAIDALRDFPDNEAISESALSLLNSLCGLAQNRKDLEELGGIEAIVGTMYVDNFSFTNPLLIDFLYLNTTHKQYTHLSNTGTNIRTTRKFKAWARLC